MILPENARWWINSETLDFCFRARPTDFEIVNSLSDFRGCDEVNLIGSYDYANGGGAYAVFILHEGYVFGIDLERSPERFLFNSSYEAFAKTFYALHRHLSANAELPINIGATVAGSDPIAFERSEWRILIEHLLSDED
jgi:hypothetical protein